MTVWVVSESAWDADIFTWVFSTKYLAQTWIEQQEAPEDFSVGEVKVDGLVDEKMKRLERCYD